MNEPKPKREKKQYDEGFRRNAVALVESSGRSLVTSRGRSQRRLRGAWAAALAFAIVGLAVFLYALPTVITSASGFCK